VLWGGEGGPGAGVLVQDVLRPDPFGLWTLEELFHGNGVTLRTQKVIQGGDNGHVGRPCQPMPGFPCSSLSGTLLRVTGPLPSLVLRTEDMWQK